MHVQPLQKRITCNDGISLSVQANEHAYCSPRDNSGQYTQVEIGYIKDSTGNRFPAPDYLREYADEDDSAYSTVYGYVPVELVERFIAEHGGRKFFTTIRPFK